MVVGTMGCESKPKYQLIPAKGIVMIDGKPAADIAVQFQPDIEAKTSGPTSQATSGPDGRFELRVLQTNELGAVAGNHRVTLFDTTEERPAQGETATRPPRLSPKFSMNVTGLRVYVEKDKEVVLEATSK